MISVGDLLKDILNGEFDAFEKQISDAYRLRKKNKGLLPLDQIRPGMEARLVNTNKDLMYSPCTVRSIDPKTRFVFVELASKKGTISCSPGQLEFKK